MRAVLAVALLTLATTGCAELGLVTDGSSISYGRPSRGRLIDGVRLPDKGEGFTTREQWATRGNRYGTDELVDLLTGVSRRLHKQFKDTRLVIADLSSRSGRGAHKFHKSHQTGRDVDLLYYMVDPNGKPYEADSMRVFDRHAKAKDGSGITVDIPRTWLLARELLTADEAFVQYIFMYQPIANKVIEHAVSLGEPEYLIARAMRTMRQPGDSAPHNDHMHVRIYCARNDRQFGCLDSGPMEMLAERESERARLIETIARAEQPAPSASTDVASAVTTTEPASPPQSASDVWASSPPSATLPAAASLGSLFRR